MKLKAFGPRRGKAPSSLVPEVFIMTDVGALRPLYWRVSAEGIEQVERPESGRVISFDKADHRLMVGRALNNEMAKRTALREYGEKCRVVVNRRKKLIYATPIIRLEELGHETVPGCALLDALLEDQVQPPDQAWIAGFLFSASHQPGRSVLILFAVEPNGDIGRPQVTINPDNMELTVGQFATLHDVSLEEGEGLLLFDNAEALAASRMLQSYPGRDDWHGVPVSLLQKGGVSLCGFITAVSLALSVYSGVIAGKRNQEAAALNKKHQAVQRATGEIISSGIWTLARNLSLDEQKMFVQAQALWMPHTTVHIIANAEAVNLVLRLSKEYRLPTGGSGRTPHEALRQMLERATPEGLTFAGIFSTGDLNEIFAKYTYTDANPDFDHLRGE